MLPDGPPEATCIAAERILLARRRTAPDMDGALTAALVAGCGALPPDGPALRAARAIAAEVERHGAGFPPGAEPAYHNRHHQAEATLVMGWMCGRARIAGTLDAADALLGVAAMAAHDLLHPGGTGTRLHELEERSAQAAAILAGAAGAAPDWIAALRDIVLATGWPRDPGEIRMPPLHRLAREADLFGSVTPHLGPCLSRSLAAEFAAAGVPGATAIGTHRGRLGFLLSLPEFTPAGCALGMGWARETQRAAYARCAPDGDAMAGAAALDGLAPHAAKARYAQAREAAP